MNHVPERIPDVVTEVARRLIDIRRFAQAAELYEGIDAHREAINVYIAGGLWDQAKQLARSAAPQFAAEVEAAHKAHMQQSGAAADLVHTGNVAEGIEAYAQQNEWDRARELAQQQGPAMLLKCATRSTIGSRPNPTPHTPRISLLSRYATLHGAHLIQSNLHADAAKVFAAHGTATQGANLAMYRRVAKEVLASGEGGGADGGVSATLPSLRKMLASVSNSLRAPGGDEAAAAEFDQWLWIAHLVAAKALAAERGMAEGAKKIAVNLLRFIREAPADKAFYEAGMACKATGDLNMAFVFLNRFLDITEAMEDHEPSSTTLDNSDFTNTEIPYDFPLPDKHFLGEAEREKVRDFVLELSMNSSVQQALPTDELRMLFKEADDVRETVARGGAMRDELFQLVQAAVRQVTG